MKDPEDFPFHSASWFMATRCLTREERGDYIDLLALQWQKDGLPVDLDEFAQEIGYKNSKKLSKKLIEKFPICGEKRRNPRLEMERDRQRERMMAARDKALKMNEAKKLKASSTGTTRHPVSDPARNPQREVETTSSESLDGTPLLYSTHTHTQNINNNSLFAEEKKPEKKRRGPKPKIDREPVPPESVEQCIDYAMEIGTHWRDGAWFWSYFQEHGWRKPSTQQPVLNWKKTMDTYHAGGFFPSRKTPHIFDPDEPPPGKEPEPPQHTGHPSPQPEPAKLSYDPVAMLAEVARKRREAEEQQEQQSAGLFDDSFDGTF